MPLSLSTCVQLLKKPPGLEPKVISMRSKEHSSRTVSETVRKIESYDLRTHD